MKKLAATILVFLAISGLNLVFGQSKPAIPAEKASVVTEASSSTNEAELGSVREQLFKFLRMSPRLTMAISTDPSLLGYQEYVSRYNPELATFIQRHPEIARNPEFYLFGRLPGGQGRDVPFLFQRAVWPEIGQGSNQSNGDLIAFFVFLVVLAATLWLLRLLLQNRRWNRIFKVQTDIHTKLMDKLGGNQELFTYLGSDAGKKFMELAPISSALESSRPGGLPGSISRILAPLQFGIVATMAGIGVLYIKGYLRDSGALLLVGTLALTLGIGLILSAGISWIIARRLGLLSEKSEANQ